MYVKPVVEYADVAWSCSITAQQRKILEHLQKRPGGGGALVWQERVSGSSMDSQT